jgi:hypothetical protein
MSKINVDRGIDVAQLFFLTYGTMMKPTSTFQALNEVFYIQMSCVNKMWGWRKECTTWRCREQQCERRKSLVIQRSWNPRKNRKTYATTLTTHKILERPEEPWLARDQMHLSNMWINLI